MSEYQGIPSSSFSVEESLVNIKDKLSRCPKLLHFVKESTKIFDESHDWRHAVIVTSNTHNVMQSLSDNYEEELVTYAAMLHDVCDHKYPESISREELVKFIVDSTSTVLAERIMKIIDNVSYSKQVKGLRQELSEPDVTYLNALSDADRLEAIGQVGIARCTAFTLKMNGKVNKPTSH